MPSRIYLSPPHMGGTEQDFVKQAFDTNWIAPLGPNVNGFEQDLQQFTGAPHAAVLTSGTAAIHLSLVLLGVQPGDVVFCQSLTFSATANPTKYIGATPVFIDSEPHTWNMCPNALESALYEQKAKGKKPKAIIPVHLYGMPANMEAIMQIANNYEIPIIEDAAEALGSHINGQKCGTFGEIGILSFNGNKIITTSGGGALLSTKGQLVQKARFLATQARDNAPHYQHSEVGYNYRMSNVLAGIGRGQMTALPLRIEQRRANYQWYWRLLATTPGITFVEEPPGYFSNRWLTTILVDPTQTEGVTREHIRLALEEHNIEARPLWKPMHLQPVFDGCPYYGGTVAEELFDKGLCLPSGSSLTHEERSRIEEILVNTLGGKHLG